jgi:hypothetical protein
VKTGTPVKSGHCIHNASLLLACLLALLAASAWAQGAPAGLSLAERAAKRFPQPVRVGDLYDRQVLEPSNHQGVLGRVDQVVRTADGQLDLIVRYGGVLGFFTRNIAVPIEATTLLGQFMQIDDIDQTHLAALPTFNPAGTTPLKPDDIIRIGINRN